MPIEDHPQGVDLCANYDDIDSSEEAATQSLSPSTAEDALKNEKSINPNLFQSFFACKYGPLKVGLKDPGFRINISVSG